MAAQAALSGAFAAEEITLANGRVLTGETVRTEADGVILATGERSLTVPWDMVSPAYRFRHDAVYRAEAMDAPIPPDGSADRFAPLVVPDPGSIGMAVAEPPAWAFRAPDPVPVTEWLQTLDERDEVMGVFAIHYGSGPEHVALFAAGRLDEKGRSGAVWVRDAAGASWEEAARYQADYPDGSAFAFRMISLRSRGAHARVDTDVSCRLDGTTGSLNLVMEVRLGRRGDSETWQLRWQPTLHAPATESLLPVTLLGPPSLRVEPRHDGEDLRAEVSLHAGGGDSPPPRTVRSRSRFACSTRMARRLDPPPRS